MSSSVAASVTGRPLSVKSGIITTDHRRTFRITRCVSRRDAKQPRERTATAGASGMSSRRSAIFLFDAPRRCGKLNRSNSDPFTCAGWRSGKRQLSGVTCTWNAVLRKPTDLNALPHPSHRTAGGTPQVIGTDPFPPTTFRQSLYFCRHDTRITPFPMNLQSELRGLTL